MPILTVSIFKLFNTIILYLNISKIIQHYLLSFTRKFCITKFISFSFLIPILTYLS